MRVFEIGVAAGRKRARAIEQDVINQNDAESEDEARQLAVLAVARAQREPDRQEHHRENEF